MNETINIILKRRSIRQFKPDQIKDDELTAILEVGKFAPSGMNAQPWHFSVIQSRDLLNKINRTIQQGMKDLGNTPMTERARAKDFSIFYHAPTLIVVSADPGVATPLFDCALAMGNMFLAAASLGIGSCWIHAISRLIGSETDPQLMAEIGVPEGYAIYAAGAFGYNADQLPPAPQRREGTVNIIR